MSTPTAKPAAVPGAPYYVWEVPGRVSVRLHFDVIDRVLPEVMRGFGALPRRGAEVGGLLIGRVLEENPLVVSIEDFEPIACEYLTGPSYRMSQRDLVKLEESLEQWKGRPLGVVGWCRSHTRKDLFLDEHDLALIQRYFSDPRQVVLAVKPFATRASIGGFFYWENGEMRLDAPYSQFPFNRRELGGGDPRGAAPRAKTAVNPQLASPPLPPPLEPVRRAEPTPERKPLPVLLQPVNKQFTADSLPVPVPEQRKETRFESAAARYEVAPPDPEPEPPPLPPPPRSFAATAYPTDSLELSDAAFEPPASSSWKRVLAVLAGLVLIVGAALVYQTINKTTEPQVAATTLPLDLAVAQNGRQLDVSWNREAAAVRNAVKGVLEIQDGGASQVLALTALQLRSGLVRYTRVTGQVNLKLEVYSSESASVSESTRVVAPDSEQVASIPPPPVEKAVESTPPPEDVSPPNTSTLEVKAPEQVEVPPEVVETPRPKPAARTTRPRTRVERREPEPAPPVVEAPKPPVEEAEPVREIARPARRR